MLKLFVDDIRDAPKGYVLVSSYDDALIDYVLGGYRISDGTPFTIDEISLDHDMGENAMTGYEFLCRIEEYFASGAFFGLKGCEFKIHSANPVGRKNMEAAIASINRLRINQFVQDIKEM